MSSASQSRTEQTLISITRDLQFSCPLVVFTSLAGLLAVFVVSALSVGSQDISRLTFTILRVNLLVISPLTSVS